MIKLLVLVFLLGCVPETPPPPPPDALQEYIEQHYRQCQEYRDSNNVQALRSHCEDFVPNYTEEERQLQGDLCSRSLMFHWGVCYQLRYDYVLQQEEQAAGRKKERDAKLKGLCDKHYPKNKDLCFRNLTIPDIEAKVREAEKAFLEKGFVF